MIEIRVARYPDSAAAVEAIFREYLASPTVGLALQGDERGNPVSGTELSRRGP